MEWEGILDVAVMTNQVLDYAPGHLRSAEPPVRNREVLGTDVWVQRIEGDLPEKILEACSLKGLWVSPPVRQFGQLYSFCRQNAPHDDNIYQWDPDLRLTEYIGLSRLVHPNSMDLRYSARVRPLSDGREPEIVPGPIDQFGNEAWVAQENHRNWLTVSDCAELRGLVSATPVSQLPGRIQNAFFYLEYAFRTYFLDVRWVLVAVGLESLVHNNRTGSTKQFVERLEAIARTVGQTISRDDLEEFYDRRSILAHGQILKNLADPTARVLYLKMETFLRFILSRAILDTGFSACFASETVIRSRWPI